MRLPTQTASITGQRSFSTVELLKKVSSWVKDAYVRVLTKYLKYSGIEFLEVMKEVQLHMTARNKQMPYGSIHFQRMHWQLGVCNRITIAQTTLKRQTTGLL